MRPEGGHGPDRRQVITTLAAGVLAGSCGRSEMTPGSVVRLFAAASLQDALAEVGAAWQSQGNAGPTLNAGASSTLARQIEQGAHADLFLSADTAWMDHLDVRGLLKPGTRINLLGNALVLIAPAGRPFVLSPVQGADLGAAMRGGRLAIADPSGVPAGRYAREALERLGMWDQVKDRLVLGDTVRTALQFVATGEAAAGVVYRSDALAGSDRVVIAGRFPEDSHSPIIYPMARVRPAMGEEAAANAADGLALFMRSTIAADIFVRHGFSVLGA